MPDKSLAISVNISQDQLIEMLRRMVSREVYAAFRSPTNVSIADVESIVNSLATLVAAMIAAGKVNQDG